MYLTSFSKRIASQSVKLHWTFETKLTITAKHNTQLHKGPHWKQVRLIPITHMTSSGFNTPTTPSNHQLPVIIPQYIAYTHTPGTLELHLAGFLPHNAPWWQWAPFGSCGVRYCSGHVSVLVRGNTFSEIMYSMNFIKVSCSISKK
jgi:hypothetical protein